jgi:hypothetical protein
MRYTLTKRLARLALDRRLPFCGSFGRRFEGFSAEDLLPFKLARSASMMSMTLPLVREARFSIGWPLCFF